MVQVAVHAALLQAIHYLKWTICKQCKINLKHMIKVYNISAANTNCNG